MCVDCDKEMQGVFLEGMIERAKLEAKYSPRDLILMRERKERKFNNKIKKIMGVKDKDGNIL